MTEVPAQEHKAPVGGGCGKGPSTDSGFHDGLFEADLISTPDSKDGLFHFRNERLKVDYALTAWSPQSVGELRSGLLVANLDVGMFGTADAKGLEDLWAEVQGQESYLVSHSQGDYAQVFRVLHVVNVLIRRREWQGDGDIRKDLVLVEAYELSSDDRFRRRMIPPSRRISKSMLSKEGGITSVAMQCIEEEVSLRGALCQIDMVELSVATSRWSSSVSYPGLPTCYVIHTCLVTVGGLPRQPFQTIQNRADGLSKYHFWTWNAETCVKSETFQKKARPGGIAGDSFLPFAVWIAQCQPSEINVSTEQLNVYSMLVQDLCDEWHTLEVMPLRSGRSGALVLQIRGADRFGRCQAPCIVKFDIAEKLKEEHSTHMSMMKVLGHEHVPSVRGYLEDREGRWSAMLIELAGSRWYSPELSAKCYLMELKDIFFHERQSQVFSTVSPDIAECHTTLSSQQVVEILFRRPLSPSGANCTQHVVNIVNVGILYDGSHSKLKQSTSILSMLDSYMFQKPHVGGKPRGPTADVLDLFKADASRSYMEMMSGFRSWLTSFESKPIVERSFYFGPQHLDLNGSNVLVDTQNCVWMIDFMSSSTQGFLCADACKLELTILLEYSDEFTFDWDPALSSSCSDAHSEMIRKLYKKCIPWVDQELRCTMVDLTSPLGLAVQRVLVVRSAYFRQLSNLKESYPHTTMIIQWNFCLLHYALKALRFEDLSLNKKKVALMIVGYVAENLQNIQCCSNNTVVSSPLTSQQWKFEWTLEEAETEYTLELLRLSSVIVDPMSGEKYDILEQCSCLKVLHEQELEKARLGSSANDVMNRLSKVRSNDRSIQSAVRSILYAESNTKHTLVVGPPASGKTVLMKQLLLVNALGRRVFRSTIGHDKAPVIIPLMELSFLMAEGDLSPSQAVEALWHRHYGRNSASYMYLMSMVKDGKLFMLFDGLDEVRHDLMLPILQYMQDMATIGHHLVVSTRPTQWDMLIEYFGGSVGIAKMMHSSTKRRVHVSRTNWNWGWAVVQDLNAGTKLMMAKTRLRKNFSSFITQVDAKKDFRELSNSPLLFSLLMHIFQSRRGDLPSDRGSLYRECVRALVGGLEEVKRARASQGEIGSKADALESERALDFLEGLAYHLHIVRGTRDFTRDDALEAARLYRNDTRFCDEETLKNCEKVWSDNIESKIKSGRLPLVTPIGLSAKGKMTYRFVHLTFQEFLASCHILHPLIPTKLDACTGVVDIENNFSNWLEVPSIMESLDKTGGSIVKVLEEHFGKITFRLDSAEQVMKFIGVSLTSLQLMSLYLTLRGSSHLSIKTDDWQQKCLESIMKERGPSDLFRVLSHLSDIPTKPSLPRFENINISSLSLKSCSLSFEQMSGLCSSLKENSTVKELNLSFNPLGDDGISKLVGCLEVNRNVKVIMLKACSIGPKGCSQLLSSLKKNSIVERLVLDENTIGDGGVLPFSEYTVHCKTRLASLSLYKTALTQEGAMHVSSLLTVCKTLLSLSLSSNAIGDIGAQLIAEALERNRTLQDLRLWDCHFSAEGAYALAHALQNNSVLKSLNIANNNIGAEGARALAPAIRLNRQMKSGLGWLNMRGNILDRGSILALEDSLEGVGRSCELIPGNCPDLDHGYISDRRKGREMLRARSASTSAASAPPSRKHSTPSPPTKTKPKISPSPNEFRSTQIQRLPGTPTSSLCIQAPDGGNDWPDIDKLQVLKCLRAKSRKQEASFPPLKE